MRCSVFPLSPLSYQGLCELIRRKTKGEDGVYFTYTEEHPISFNPFYTDDYYFDGEKKDSIKTQGDEKELTLFTCSQKGTMRFVVRCIYKEAVMDE